MPSEFHWFFSLLGTIGCFAVMFLINAVATVLAIVFIGIVYTWLRRRRLKTTWGDVRSGMLLQIIRYALLRLEKDINPKSWRPNILVLSGSLSKRWHLIDFANGITQEKGLFTVATILEDKNVTQEKVNSFAVSILVNSDIFIKYHQARITGFLASFLILYAVKRCCLPA